MIERIFRWLARWIWQLPERGYPSNHEGRA